MTAIQAKALAGVSSASLDAAPVGWRRDAHWEGNLRSPAFSARAIKALRSTVPRGWFQVLPDGTPLLRWGAARLGAPASHSEVTRSLQEMPSTSIVVVFGFGTGQLARLVRMLTGAPTLVFEPEPGLLRTAMERGPLCVGDLSILTDTEQVRRKWHALRGRFSEARVIATPGYAEAFPAQFAQLQSSLRRLTRQTAISQATYCGRARTWVRDILANLELVQSAPPFARLAGKYRGVPAFIVGAGPSLDKNIDAVKEAARKGIVFATNSGALALAQRGIEPQVVVCIESMDVSDRLEQLPFLDRSVRAFSLSASPKVLRTGRGPLLHCHEALPQYDRPLRDLLGVGGVLTSGSVSTAATSLARLAGCSPIVLVGHDLAYTSGATYARGTGYESSRAQLNEAASVLELTWNSNIQELHARAGGTRCTREVVVEVPAWGGATSVASTDSFVAIREWFESLARLCAERQLPTELINATEGGSQIAGFAEERLSDVLRRLPVLDLTSEQLAREAGSGFEGVSVRELCRWLLEQHRAANKVRRRARRCVRIGRLCLELVKKGHSKGIRIAQSQMEEAEAQLRACVQEHPLVDAWAHRDVQRCLAACDTEDLGSEKSIAGALQRGVRLAEAVDAASQTLIEEIAETSQRLEANARQGVQACP